MHADEEKIIDIIKRFADNGHGEAQIRLINYYINDADRGTKKDLDEAFKYCRLIENPEKQKA